MRLSARRLAADADAAGVLGPIEKRRLAGRGAVAQRDRAAEHEPRYIGKRSEQFLPDRVPPNILKLLARDRLAEYMGRVGKEETRVEPAVRV